MKRLLPILIVVLTLLTGCRGRQAEVVVTAGTTEEACSTVARWDDGDVKHRQAATLTDERHNQRLTSMRSQRLLSALWLRAITMSLR